MLLYIHIPFCDSKCSYCAFNSYVDKFSLREAYMNALVSQLKTELTRFNVSRDNLIETVFIGGGTPSTVEPSLYRPLFEMIEPFLADTCEITSEANPNSATRSWLEGMYELGVNRLSFGVQSFNNEKLKTLGRAHHTQQALEAIRIASAIGYKHLSIDLIYGVREDTKALLKADIDQALLLPIDHISLYALTIEENTVFEKTPELAQEELEQTQWLFRTLAENGFNQYEISNFGKYRSRHNIGYWEHKPYIGLGSGAVGFLDNRRYYPSTSVEHYIQNPLEISVETIEPEALLSEKLFLGFRSCVGVEESLLNQKQKKHADLLVQEGMLNLCNGRYFNNDFLLADEIALRVEGF
ncbi:MAG: radical SAM family heme chaperone HemW [Sulfuricurvum sp.]|uniref:radical SAM family heme chaperone HemW n=1 Tax=Sulfuricurvum sp. TaxID=2025608 RepID=UPI00263511B0|nr:radical SAM family heme chaperone HemW [Sulfuricurvum sp.]MDD2367741.1 radical SAM family heme chaperone HemW [Sulfuricurvum sp.]MDD5117345.1 radical SAM family heme chaperone HemW [Sulfuricurvum sp.]